MKHYFLKSKWLALLPLILLLPMTTVYSQFSPGELAKSHAYLEGMDNCTRCHDLGKKLDKQKCLDCHTLIKGRIDAKTGYHASSEVQSKTCMDCHHDHLGRDFQMTEWKPSKEKFDHRVTGYQLEGKHKTAKCEACHKSEFVKDASVNARAKDGLSLSKTFLGLSQECTSCHFDEHRGQLKDCAKCHDFSDWKKSSETLFDHTKTKYALTNAHTSLECIKCHVKIADPQKMTDGKTDPDYSKYSPLDFKNCTPCHADPHQNKFGQNCESCHSTTSWLDIRNKQFDHKKTRYPLIEKHSTVACEACHQPDRKKPPIYKDMKFNACLDCHKDAHVGQLAQRTDHGACETCHNLKGFHPSIFTTTMHNSQSKYVLQGAHEKTDCIKCHVKLTPKEFTSRTGLKVTADSSHLVLKFLDQRCLSCHADIHRGQFAEKLKTKDCDICHKTTTWKDLVFNHDKDARFPLLGKHKSQTCGKCHKTLDSNTAMKRVLYKPVSIFCESCHRDIHEAQFVTNKLLSPERPQTYCENCHKNDSFRPSIFDHSKQSRYALDGAHIKVECTKCHPKTRISSDTLVTQYKPISTECAACHADQHEGVFEKK